MDDVQQGAVDAQFTVVLDEAQLAEAIARARLPGNRNSEFAHCKCSRISGPQTLRSIPRLESLPARFVAPSGMPGLSKTGFQAPAAAPSCALDSDCSD